MVNTNSLSIEEYASRNRSQPGGGINEFSRVRYEQAVRHFPAHVKTILDIGCHGGVGSSVLRKHYPEAQLIGLDCVAERVEDAKVFYDRAICGLATQTGLEDGSVCVLFAGELIEHLTYDDASAFLAEARRVLKDGGRLILTTPNPRYLRLALTGRSVLDDPAHLSQFSVAQMKCLLKENGFRIVAMKGTGRISTRLGTAFPISMIYGSYMAVAEK